MSHPAQMAFIAGLKARFPRYFHGGRVLEIGSLNINGTVRDFFDAPQEYIGVDVGEGPGVDVVALGHKYKEKSDFDCVISCECLEHNPYWEATFYNMQNRCRPDGLVVMTCATGNRPEHGTTRTTPQDSPLTIAKQWDYYGNLSVSDLLDFGWMDSYWKAFAFEVDHTVNDLYFWGIKA